jgi:translation initiation factor IF-1
VLESAHDFFVVEVTLGAAKKKVICKLAGRLHKHRIKVMPGDDVEVELSPYDLGKGRITFRGRRERTE